MVATKVIIEILLVIIALALIIWYVATNYHSISEQFGKWFEGMKEYFNVS
jgi:hypothetical protein